MSTERHDRVFDLFRRACELPEAEREAFLKEACGDDDAMRTELKRLLAQDASDPKFLETPAMVQFAAATGAQPTVISKYRIIRVLGSGGMGVVYLAEQDSPHRTVALKVLAPGAASSDMLARFAVEADALARLQHPGIAQIYEAGTADSGAGVQPFFAMEYVQGQSLLEHAEAKKLDDDARLDLLAHICDAIHHAHQKGVIHRDLKPANIIVTDDGRPKVLDFGVARLTDADIKTTTLRTNVGELIGTIPYMSPEQAAGQARDLDTRSDVYALGVIGYELLSGRLPYDLQQRMIQEAVRVVQEQRPTPLSSISARLRGDVETIIGKALEKEPQRRYQSASAFGEDIRRFLNDEPITARPASAVYQVRKFAQRNTALVGGAAAFVLLLVAAVIVTSLLAKQLATQRDEAVELRTQADEARALEVEQRGLAVERLAAAEEREAQMRKIADFQASMLRGLNPAKLGTQLHDDILAAFRKTGEREGRPSEEVEQEAQALAKLLTAVNFTDVTLSNLDRTIFKRVVSASPHVLADQPVVEGYLLQTIANAYDDLGMYEEALPVQERALMRLREGLGDDAAYTIGAIMGTGVVLWHLRRIDEAEVYYREAFERADRALGPDNPRTLQALANLAIVVDEKGNTAEAIERTQDMLERFSRVRGETHPDALKAHINLGEMLVTAERPREAEVHFRKAREISEQTLGPDDPISIVALVNYGSILLVLDRGEESLEPLRTAAERAERTLGNRHAYTLASLLALAEALEKMQRTDELVATLRHAVEIQASLSGDDDPETIELRGRLEQAQLASTPVGD